MQERGDARPVLLKLLNSESVQRHTSGCCFTPIVCWHQANGRSWRLLLRLEAVS
jgi:hypothetical protein